MSEEPEINRVLLLVIDALGIGVMPDVPVVRPNDVGADTLGHVVKAAGPLSLPNLERLGLGTIAPQSGLRIEKNPIGAYGVCSLGYEGADTFLGHQVLMGSPVPDAEEELFESIRADAIGALRQSGHKVEPAKDGLAALFVDDAMVVGDNLESDPLQTYHVVGSLDELPYETIVDVGEILRSVARVRRVVAMGGRGYRAEDIRRCVERRPSGQSGVNNVELGLYTSNYIVRHFTRGTRPNVQIPTIMHKAGYSVELIGKVADVITCEGARKAPHVPTPLVLNEVYDALERVKRGLIAVNIQETDLAGHDESAQRYADCLRMSDDGIGKIMTMLGPKDVLMITGDHGNDPTIGHDKHTREFTPCLVWGRSVRPTGLYMRDSLADFAATISEIFAVPHPEIGKSFWNEVRAN